MKRFTFVQAIFTILILFSIAFFSSCSKSGSNPKPQIIPTAIASLSITHGPFNTNVIITGTGFSSTIANDQVSFNGKAATVTAATATQLTATVPLASGTGNVTISINNGTSVTGPVFTYELSAVVSTVAGSTKSGSANGKGALASFSVAYGIVADASGNLYVCDKNDYLIRKITSDGTVTTLAGSGSYGSADGTGAEASFSEPLGLTFDSQGNLLVTDFVNNLIRKISPSGAVTTVQVITNQTGYSNPLFTPVGIAVDANNSLYVSGFWFVTKLDMNGLATIFAGGDQAGLTDGGPGTATLESPKGLKIDKNGILFVVDANTIRMIDKNNIVSTLAGVSSAGYADGKGDAARFNSPTDLAIDNAGNIYITDQHNRLIRKIASDGTVTTVAGNINTSNSVDGAGSNAGFSSPNGICLDATGNLYVTDGNEIRKITFE